MIANHVLVSILPLWKCNIQHLLLFLEKIQISKLQILLTCQDTIVKLICFSFQYVQVGPEGAGHFVKMVHNGIEYGDMQLICEAYQVMKDGLGMSHKEMAEVSRRGAE